MKRRPVAFVKPVVYLLMVTTVFVFLSQHCGCDDLYVVKDIQVDVVAESAIAARQSAHMQGKRRAYAVLLSRLQHTSTEAQNSPSDEELEYLIDHYAVFNEKDSKNRYLAQLNVSFNSKAVREFLDHNSPETSTSQEYVSVIVPVLSKLDETLLWEEENPWLHSWNSDAALPKDSVIPVGDLEDMSSLTIEDISTENSTKMKKLMDRYHANNLVIVTYKETHSDQYQLSVKQYTKSGLINHHGPWTAKNIESTKDTWSQARDEIKETFATLKEAFEASSKPKNFYSRVNFKSFSEWRKIKIMLNQISSIKDLNIESLNREHAYIRFTYAGPLPNLLSQLKNQGLEPKEVIDQWHIALSKDKIIQGLQLN